MIETVYIAGRFIDMRSQQPLDGPIELIPSRLWVEEGDVAYATLAPSTITVQGKFLLPVTACHKREGDFGLFYTIICPMGKWTIRPDGEDGAKIMLKDLLPQKRIS